MNFKNLYQNEYSFEEIVNENFLKVDNFTNLSIKRKIYNFYEEGIEENKLYLISNKDGVIEDEIFKGKINQITFYNNNLGWLFYKPEVGNIAYLQSERTFYYYDGEKWEILKTDNTDNQKSDGFCLGMMMRGYKTFSSDKWLKSAGQINDGKIYVNIYNELVNCWKNGKTGTTTIKGENYTYKELDGIRVITKTNWEKIYSKIGIVGFFGLNIDTQAFYLPFVEEKKRVLVDTQKATQEIYNGSRWYNLYSDGWLEQGGCYTSGSRKDDYSDVFLLPYIDTSYSLEITQWALSAPTSIASFLRIDKFVSGFTVGRYAYTGMEYRACGYSNQITNFDIDFYNYFFIG